MAFHYFFKFSEKSLFFIKIQGSGVCKKNSVLLFETGIYNVNYSIVFSMSRVSIFCMSSVSVSRMSNVSFLLACLVCRFLACLVCSSSAASSPLKRLAWLASLAKRQP